MQVKGRCQTVCAAGAVVRHVQKTVLVLPRWIPIAAGFVCSAPGSEGVLVRCRNVENPGRIMIMTSNYPERLDKALVRKVTSVIAPSVVLAGSVTQLDRVPGR